MIVFRPLPLFETIAISDCKLSCTHCHGKYLKQMKKKSYPDELLSHSRGFKGNGFLISGGFDRKGRLLNLIEMASTIRAIRKKHFIAIHLGFIDYDDASLDINSLCDISFVDIPSEYTIESVYKLP